MSKHFRAEPLGFFARKIQRDAEKQIYIEPKQRVAEFKRRVAEKEQREAEAPQTLAELICLHAELERFEAEAKQRDAETKQRDDEAKQRANEVRIFEIPGLLANHSTKALGDYGAKNNFIKEEFALRLGLPIDRDAICKVIVGNGKPVTTTGTISASFRFKGEHHVHTLKLRVLSNCIHNVILGKSFLKLTETFSKPSNFFWRVK
jgi:hypothetical protein